MLDDSLPLYGVVSRTAFEHPLEIRRVNLLGEPGFLMSLPRAAVESTLYGLLAVGCARGTADEFEARRIEAGFPYYGADITEDNLAQEVARTKQCISFTKGCYLGQEPIARLDAMGHTNRELRRIRFRPGVSVVRGSRLLAAESDDEAGEITSVAPLLDSVGQTTCLGYLKTRFHRPDTQVRIAGTDSATLGIVLAVDE
jgi:folate-binding protein YgfZ